MLPTAPCALIMDMDTYSGHYGHWGDYGQVPAGVLLGYIRPADFILAVEIWSVPVSTVKT